VVLLAGAMLSGCRAAPVTTGAPVPTSLPASACSGSVLAGDIGVSIMAGGVRRSVIVHIPKGYTDLVHEPLVLNLHGSGSNAAQQEGFSGMDAAADADGFVVAYPQGAIASGSGFDWNVPGQPLLGGGPVPANAPDDVAFLAQVIHTLETGLCIDATRVYATGFSGGARMTSQLGCDLSTTIAAIAPVSGLRLPSPCASSRPMPVISFHGTADPVDPYNGKGQAYWTYSVPVAAQRWAVHDGCAASPVFTDQPAGAQFTEFTGCGGGAEVILCTLTGEGHEWPGGPALPPRDTDVLGPQTNAVDANATMWQFFTAHPLPSSVTASTS